MNWLGELVQREIQASDTVLDLGCGIMQATDGLLALSILGVDVFPKYLDHIKEKHQTVRISLDETDRFMDKSYDVVICLDVVEHLPKELALKILDECKRICRRKAIIFTPLEFDDNTKAVENSWDLGYNEHQKHICQITKQEFRTHGYHVIKTDDYNLLGVYDGF